MAQGLNEAIVRGSVSILEGTSEAKGPVLKQKSSPSQFLQIWEARKDRNEFAAKYKDGFDKTILATRDNDTTYRDQYYNYFFDSVEALDVWPSTIGRNAAYFAGGVCESDRIGVPVFDAIFLMMAVGASAVYLYKKDKNRNPKHHTAAQMLKSLQDARERGGKPELEPSIFHSLFAAPAAAQKCNLATEAEELRLLMVEMEEAVKTLYPGKTLDLRLVEENNKKRLRFSVVTNDQYTGPLPVEPDIPLKENIDPLHENNANSRLRDDLKKAEDFPGTQLVKAALWFLFSCAIVFWIELTLGPVLKSFYYVGAAAFNHWIYGTPLPSTFTLEYMKTPFSGIGLPTFAMHLLTYGLPMLIPAIYYFKKWVWDKSGSQEQKIKQRKTVVEAKLEENQMLAAALQMAFLKRYGENLKQKYNLQGDPSLAPISAQPAEKLEGKKEEGKEAQEVVAPAQNQDELTKEELRQLKEGSFFRRVFHYKVTLFGLLPWLSQTWLGKKLGLSSDFEINARKGRWFKAYYKFFFGFAISGFALWYASDSLNAAFGWNVTSIEAVLIGSFLIPVGIAIIYGVNYFFDEDRRHDRMMAMIKAQPGLVREMMGKDKKIRQLKEEIADPNKENAPVYADAENDRFFETMEITPDLSAKASMFGNRLTAFVTRLGTLFYFTRVVFGYGGVVAVLGYQFPHMDIFTIGIVLGVVGGLLSLMNYQMNEKDMNRIEASLEPTALKIRAAAMDLEIVALTAYKSSLSKEELARKSPSSLDTNASSTPGGALAHSPSVESIPELSVDKNNYSPLATPTGSAASIASMASVESDTLSASAPGSAHSSPARHHRTHRSSSADQILPDNVIFMANDLIRSVTAPPPAPAPNNSESHDVLVPIPGAFEPLVVAT